jgi:NADPH-dependent 2,4-dienoyl-CoA reductase/sulfur reductase-like enzyme
MMQRRQFVGAGLGAAAALSGCQPAPSATAHILGGFTDGQPERGHWLRDRLHSGKPWPQPDKVFTTRVLIAGGGVAGLAAARALRLRGMEDFALLEMEDTAGGNSRGGQLGGLACPLGAHYLPLPGDDAPEVQDLLEELGLRQRVAGRWQYDDRYLCHSPQERLFFQGNGRRVCYQ